MAITCSGCDKDKIECVPCRGECGGRMVCRECRDEYNLCSECSKKRKEEERIERALKSRCPDCGGPLVSGEGQKSCPVCGYPRGD